MFQVIQGHGFYTVHWNYCMPVYICGHPVYFYVYPFFVLLLLLAIALKALFPIRVKSFLSMVLALLLLVTIGLQTWGQERLLSLRGKVLDHKTVDQKNLLLYGRPYQFVKIIQAHLKKNHYQGAYITDAGLENSVDFNVFRYHLFPQVDLIRVSKNADCLIMFNKTDAKKSVPPNFLVIASFGPDALAAVKGWDR